MAKDVLSWFTVASKLLGLSTAGVLWAVGVETTLDGTHTGLAIYLLVSAVIITFLETAYLVDKFVMACCSPDGWAVRVWKKLAWLDYCQRFLLYGLMSVVCFLHPVAVWLATIPGIMLVASGTAYLALSYKERIRKSFTKGTAQGRVPADSDRTPVSAAAAAMPDAGGEQTFTFETEAGGQQSGRGERLDDGDDGTADRRTERQRSATKKQGSAKRVRFETLHEAADEEGESSAESSAASSAEFVTSDTAPIILGQT